MHCGVAALAAAHGGAAAARRQRRQRAALQKDGFPENYDVESLEEYATLGG
jgi:hypothetical protein